MFAFLDTNVLIYSIGLDPADARKQRIALRILADQNITFSIQVLQEFYAQATRPTRKTPLKADHARDLVFNWMQLPIIENTREILRSALVLGEQNRFSFWDASIIAAAIAGDCDILYTEDMQHGREIEGVRIVNPFLEAA